jgi:hypothetical protein
MHYGMHYTLEGRRGAFSDRSIRALTPRSQPYRVHEGTSDKGFCVQVTPAGTKIFE